MQSIGTYHCDFPSKFGLPRQSGLAQDLPGFVTFEAAFCDLNYFRGIEEFSHLWLLWLFSEAKETGKATVRPPKLGGNERRGVFATRSPFRPNRIGLSCVRLEALELTEHGSPVLRVRGGDLMDGTPVLDVKPYLPTDAVPDAVGGFALPKEEAVLKVALLPQVRNVLPASLLSPLKQTLRLDPRPGYQNDEKRIYRLPYAGYEIGFFVCDGVLTVCEITPAESLF